MMNFLKHIFYFTVMLSLPLSVNGETVKSNLLKNKNVIQLIKTINKKNKQEINTTITEEELIGIPIDEELILTIKHKKLLLGEVFAYKSSNNARLGFINTIEVLDFPIEVDDEFTNAKGWFINTDNTFELTLPSSPKAKGTAIVNGITHYFSSDAFEIQPDDIYFDAEYIATWFGFDLDFDFSTMSVELESKTTLPVIARELRRQKKGVTSFKSQPVLPWKESSYKAISAPLYDVQLNATQSKSGSLFSGYSIVGNQDIAFLNSEYFISGSDDDLVKDVRLKFSKELEQDNFLGIKRIEFGDIRPVKIR